MAFEVSWAIGELEAGAPYEGQIGDCGDDISCGAPESWEVTFTDNNHTLLIPEEAIITNVDGNELTSGYIGVFFMNSNGEMQCAGNTQTQVVRFKLLPWVMMQQQMRLMVLLMMLNLYGWFGIVILRQYILLLPPILMVHLIL